MFPIVAGVIGLVLGLLASPNPLVAIICAVFFALVAWALTGFKTVAESTKGSQPKENSRHASAGTRSKFYIDGHGEMSPTELGAMFVQQSYELASVTIDMLFKNGSPGTTLPVANSVVADPLPARLFLTALLIAAYYIYPIRKLAVDEPAKDEIISGSVRELANLQKPNGMLFGREDVKAVQDLIVSFFDLIASDMDKSVELSPKASDPVSIAPKSTQLLLSILVSHYNGGGSASERAVSLLKDKGFYHSPYSDATKTIDDLARIPNKSLTNMNLKWVAG